MNRSQRQQANLRVVRQGRAPQRRPGAVGLDADVVQRSAPVVKQNAAPVAQVATPAKPVPAKAAQSGHPLTRQHENARLYDYERSVKAAFDDIVPALKEISALQHEADFEQLAQQVAMRRLGYELPESILADAWVEQLDMRRLYAWCVFETYRQFCDRFFSTNPLAGESGEDFNAFLQDCGFHILDITPCADGRLAHMVRYVLRLPQDQVRRKSYAGAMFDVEDSIQKWVEVEMLRFREGKPNLADASTRYLKMVAYHFSSVDPEHEGCAAHGSDTGKAAASGLERLESFQQAVENSFCCGASIDLLLVGLDTDTDAIRVHVPDADGKIHLDRFVDAMDVYKVTQYGSAAEGRDFIANQVRSCSPEVMEGTGRLVAQLIENNLSQIDYVRRHFGEAYPDTGHAERFIGAGVGFEEIQLRNLMYFAYLDTVEEGAADMDVGIKIFTGLNVSHNLPAPVVVRFDYHGPVPGARERAMQKCARVADAIVARYRDLAERGLLHIMQVIRDCRGDGPIEVINCSVNANAEAGAH